MGPLAPKESVFHPHVAGCLVYIFVLMCVSVSATREGSVRSGLCAC